jgi:molybdopterin converting factor small subunit
MAAVSVELLPGLSRELRQQGMSTVRREVALTSGETLGQFLARLAVEQPHLGQTLWDADAGALRPHVQVVLNGRLLAAGQVGQRVLADGDEVVFVPVYAGGAR